MKIESRLNPNLPSPTFLRFSHSKEKTQVRPSPLSLHMLIITIHVIHPKNDQIAAIPLSRIDYSGLTPKLML